MAAELFMNFEPDIESLTVIPSDGGRFEITVDEQLLFSKHNLGRHAEAGEVAGLIADHLAADG